MTTNADHTMNEEKLTKFLKELTELSMKFALGIAGKPVLFVMEREDYERKYRTDGDSNMEYV